MIIISPFIVRVTGDQGTLVPPKLLKTKIRKYSYHSYCITWVRYSRFFRDSHFSRINSSTNFCIISKYDND